MAVNCSSHNLAQLEEITSALKKDGFALDTLMGYDIHHSESGTVPDDFNEWVGLLFDRVDFIRQHISDLCVWENALRKEHDFNSEE